MDLNIEELRSWLRGTGGYRKIAQATGYPYDSLCKFANGQVKEPRWSNLGPLLTYRKHASKKRARKPE
jgi:hypothetical protein